MIDKNILNDFIFIMLSLLFILLAVLVSISCKFQKYVFCYAGVK